MSSQQLEHEVTKEMLCCRMNPELFQVLYITVYLVQG